MDVFEPGGARCDANSVKPIGGIIAHPGLLLPLGEAGQFNAS